MADVGLDAALTPSEMVYWRAAVTTRTQGITAAAEQIGFVGNDGVARLRRILTRGAMTAPDPSRMVRTFIGQ